MHITKITAAQSEVVLSYQRLRGLYFLAVIFATTGFNFSTLLKAAISLSLSTLFSIPRPVTVTRTLPYRYISQ